jgi:hypothetical protein
MNQQAETDTISKEERTWGMLCHLTVLAGFIIPFASIIAPLVIWLIKKDEMSFVDDQGKESLNFQITMFIGFIISFILAFVFIGYLLMVALAIFDLVMVIVAAMKANEGVRYRYPYSIRFLK